MVIRFLIFLGPYCSMYYNICGPFFSSMSVKPGICLFGLIFKNAVLLLLVTTQCGSFFMTPKILSLNLDSKILAWHPPVASRIP